MRKYLGIVSIIILITTYLILAYTFVGQVGGPTDTVVILTGVGLSVLAALFSKRGKLKVILLSLYGLLIGGFVIMVIGFAVAHM